MHLRRCRLPCNIIATLPAKLGQMCGEEERDVAVWGIITLSGGVGW